MKRIFIAVIIITVSVFAISQARKTGVEQPNEQKRGSLSMPEHAAASFNVKSWSETPYNEMPGVRKLTRASATKIYAGDITGEGKVEYLMMYRADGSAAFTGLECVVGAVSGHAGSFVLQHNGTFEHGLAKVTLSIVPGSGTEGLRTIRGQGQFAVGHQPPYNMTLNYALDR